MTFDKRGYCPFRVSTKSFQPGCVLIMGNEALCYSSDNRPLLFNNDNKKTSFYYCPRIRKVKLNLKIYHDIQVLIDSILDIQYMEEICTNLWKVISGISQMNKASTKEGKKLKNLTKHIRNHLDDIVFNLDDNNKDDDDK